MKQGKKICEKLKQIRLEVAKANGIEYTPFECKHEGECPGTCPACEKEVRFLEEELAKKNKRICLVFDPEKDEFVFTAVDAFDENLDIIETTQGIITFE